MTNKDEELVDSLLANQGDQRHLFVNGLSVQLSWHADVDLDLMAFYKTKSGESGGVYSSMYADNGQGSLTTFPYMQLDQDAGVAGDQTDLEKVETLKIEKLDDIAELYLVAVNFTDASQNKKSEFASFDGKVTLKNEKDEEFTVVLASKDSGSVAVFARIENTNELMGAVLHNESQVLEFKDFRANIPGADRLSLANKLLLQGQGDSAELKVLSGQISAQLIWTASVDLDLHCFYETKSHTAESSGGFLSSLFGGSKSKSIPAEEGRIYFGNRGALSKSPFIELDQDAGIGDQGGDNEENIRFGDISVINRAIIVANIYGKPNARFGTYDGRVSIKAGEQEILVPLNTKEMGAWCVIAEIDNRTGTPKIVNANQVMKKQPSIKTFSNT
jgi:tellurite resistance protein TerA